MNTQTNLHSIYDNRQELGQMLNENGQYSDYRSLTLLPMEQEGLPYGHVLHQQLYYTDRLELQAAGSKGADLSQLYVFGDHLGSNILVQDADKTEAMRLGYNPFGQVYRKHNDRTNWKLNSGVNANKQLNMAMPYQFTGRYTEKAAGLVHLDARWYNPQTARFVQPDLWNFASTGLPKEVQHEVMQFAGLNSNQLLRDPGQQMQFGYVKSVPLNGTDPYGLRYTECSGVDPISDNGLQKEYIDGSNVSYNGVYTSPNDYSPEYGDWRTAHYNRNQYNEHPESAEQAEDLGWTQLPDEKSIYHTMGPENEDNTKWVSPEGNHEGVFNGDGNPVTDPANEATYNHSDPNSVNAGHIVLDVVPYYLWGNSPEDPTNLYERLTATYDGQD